MNGRNRRARKANHDGKARSTVKRPSNHAAKTDVMACLRLIMWTGFARQAELGNGDIELTLLSGEVFHLGQTSVTRVA